MHLVKSIQSGAAAVGAFGESAESSELSEYWKIALFLSGELARDNRAPDLFGIWGDVLLFLMTYEYKFVICDEFLMFGMVYTVHCMLMHWGYEMQNFVYSYDLFVFGMVHFWDPIFQGPICLEPLGNTDFPVCQTWVKI